MNAISSFRPKAKCDQDTWRNQLAAKASWEQAFDHIFYFGKCEPELRSAKTVFVEPLGTEQDFPQIKVLADWCAHQPTWAAIVNADIVIRVPQFKAVMRELDQVGAKCALSWRYEFMPESQVRYIQQVDLGLDIFCARPEVWYTAAVTVPDMFRIGCCLWDTWMSGFFNSYGGCWDYSSAKCILHPKHGGREPPANAIDVTYRDRYTAKAGMPPHKLKLT